MSNDIDVEPIEKVGVIKNEESDNRLSFGYKRYSDGLIYEKILEKHSEYFDRNPLIKEELIEWAVNIHMDNSNMKPVSDLLKLAL